VAELGADEQALGDLADVSFRDALGQRGAQPGDVAGEGVSRTPGLPLWNRPLASRPGGLSTEWVAASASRVSNLCAGVGTDGVRGGQALMGVPQEEGKREVITPVCHNGTGFPQTNLTIF